MEAVQVAILAQAAANGHQSAIEAWPLLYKQLVLGQDLVDNDQTIVNRGLDDAHANLQTSMGPSERLEFDRAHQSRKQALEVERAQTERQPDPIFGSAGAGAAPMQPLTDKGGVKPTLDNPDRSNDPHDDAGKKPLTELPPGLNQPAALTAATNEPADVRGVKPVDVDEKPAKGKDHDEHDTKHKPRHK